MLPLRLRALRAAHVVEAVAPERLHRLPEALWANAVGLEDDAPHRDGVERECGEHVVVGALGVDDKERQRREVGGRIALRASRRRSRVDARGTRTSRVFEKIRSRMQLAPSARPSRRLQRSHSAFRS